MGEQFLATTETPHLHITTCAGSLLIQSSIQTAVTLKGDAFTATLAEADTINITSDADLTIIAPEKTKVTIDNGQTIMIKHIRGDIHIQQCSAQLNVKGVGQLVVDDVQGTVTAENINGRFVIKKAEKTIKVRHLQAFQAKAVKADINIQYATGFVDLTNIEGAIALNTVNGDVTIREVKDTIICHNLGGLNEIETSGDIRLSGTLAHGEHHFTSANDIDLDWPQDSPVTILAVGAKIINHLPLSSANDSVTADKRQRLTGHIEQGKAIVTLHAQGIVRLTDGRFPPPAPTPEIPPTQTADPLTALVSKALHNVALTNPALANALTAPTLINEIVTAIRQQETNTSHETAPTVLTPGLLLAAKAEEAVHASFQKIEETIDHAKHRLQKPATPTVETAVSPTQPTQPAQPAATTLPSNPEDRRHILRLLKEGLLTIEQANTLLEEIPPATS